mmetsp:Transcript_55603/g.180399  ORF Transcript_55603/g.180399 Transcript_55603/m.180399 type:complete len:150 (+) Transcript_55603:88-537(+)
MMSGGYMLIWQAEMQMEHRAAMLAKEEKKLEKVIEVAEAPKSIDEPGARECIVCMSRAVSTASAPCRHSILCERCMREVRKRSSRCPLCRTRIQHVVKGNFPCELADLNAAEAAIRELDESNDKVKPVSSAWPSSLQWAIDLCAFGVCR